MLRIDSLFQKKLKPTFSLKANVSRIFIISRVKEMNPRLSHGLK
jgi:hypothetical protein